MMMRRRRAWSCSTRSTEEPTVYCSTSGDVLPFWQTLVFLEGTHITQVTARAAASRINIPVDARRDGHLGPRPSAGLKRTHDRHDRQTGSTHPDGCGSGQCQDLGQCQDPHVQAEKGQNACCSSSCRSLRLSSRWISSRDGGQVRTGHCNHAFERSPNAPCLRRAGPPKSRHPIHSRRQ